MRSPFTGVIFALELTHDVNVLLPLLLAVTIAHGFTVLTLKRSILTEKVARRGYHMSREYSVDPLEILFVREVMRDNVAALPAGASAAATRPLRADHSDRGQLLYPVVDARRRLVGVMTRSRLREILQDGADSRRPLKDLANTDPVVASAGEPLRVVAYRMAETGITRMPVVRSGSDPTLVGMVSLQDLLYARTRNLEDERRRERVLRIHFPFGARVG
jgi:CBS domain-containing protein